MGGRIGPLLLAALVLTGAMHIVAQAAQGWPALEGSLSGPDGYMRLHRVALLLAGGGWYASLIPDSNVPFGELLHWTRPFDLLVLAGALPLRAILSPQEALLAWSLFLGPLLHVATALALIWAARPLLPRDSAVMLIFLFASQIFVAQQFSPGRPDHHGFLLLLFVLHTGGLLRLLQPAATARTALATGLLSALALWASPEALVAVVCGHAALALAWTWGGAPYLRAGLLHALAGAAGIVLALLAERVPETWLVVEYDRLSAVHVSILALAAGFWLVAGRIRHRRGMALLAGGIFCAGLLLWRFPGLAAGPYSQLDPRVASAYLADVGEVQAVLQPDRIALYFGLSIVALPWMLWRLRATSALARPTWLYMTVLLGLFLALGLWQARWAGYAGVLAVIPACALLGALWQRLANPLAKLASALLLALAPLMIAGFLMRLAPPPPPAVACDYHAAARHLATLPGRERVMASLYYGSAILFFSPHAVVGTAYHRNTAGILDSIRFFEATDDRLPRRIAERRGLTLVLACPRATEAQSFHFPGDTPPDWLEPLGLPPALAEWRLYRVDLAG